MTDTQDSAPPPRGGAGRRAAWPTHHSFLCVVSVLASLTGLLGLLGSHTQPLPGDRLALILLVAGLAGAARFSSAHMRSFRRAAGATIHPVEGPRGMDVAIGAVVRIASLLVIAGLCAIATGHVAHAVAHEAGVGHNVVLAWDLAKWPLLTVVVTCLMMIVRHSALTAPPVLRHVRTGQLAAGALWCLAFTGFGIYLAGFDSFTEAYGGVGTGLVLVLWLTLFSLLYYATPNMRIPLQTVAPAAAVAATAWLATAAVLSVWIAQFDATGWLLGALGTIAIVYAGILASNLALLRPSPVNSVAPLPSPLAERVDLVVVPSVALRNATAQGRMMSIFGARAAGLSDREVDMMDWGFAFGVAWAVARGQDPAAPEELVSERALQATQAVYEAYRGSRAPVVNPIAASATQPHANGGGPANGRHLSPQRQ